MNSTLPAVVQEFLVLAAFVTSLLLVAAAAPDSNGWDVWPVGDDKGCMARLESSGGNMTILVNRDGQLLLGVSRADWSSNGEVQIALGADGGPMSHQSAYGLGRMFLTKVEPAQLPAIRAAKVVDWGLPVGEAHLAAHDIGATMDAVIACQAPR